MVEMEMVDNNGGQDNPPSLFRDLTFVLYSCKQLPGHYTANCQQGKFNKKGNENTAKKLRPATRTTAMSYYWSY